MPTQLPLEATTSFGDLLRPYIVDIINSDASKSFEDWDSGPEVKGATIASNGSLTPSFEYIADMRSRRNTALSMGSKSNKSSNAKTVLVLGAGYVASPLVEILTRDENVHVIVGSELLGTHCNFFFFVVTFFNMFSVAPGEEVAKQAQKNNAESVVIDVNKNQDTLDSLVAESDLVISLLPYSLHASIAERCIEHGKNMVTASYISPEMKALHGRAVEAGITILNEVGLDPGIDHLLAMECFDQIKSNGGKITSFRSFCGGLPAPENADNPLAYKFSWNPRGVIANTLGGAKWLENGEEKEILPGGELMDSPVAIDFLKGLNLEGYPNRDSLVYRDVYKISQASTIVRGTLR